MIPTNHWNPAVLSRKTVLNTVTGAVNHVAIKDLGSSVVQTGDGARPARRYRYTGDLQVESWYDPTGRWVKLQFEGKDGSKIEYVCRRCGDAKIGNRTE